MVSYDNKADQFGSLLSNVSGVNSSAFQKKALKDVKSPDTSKERLNPSSQGQARRTPEYGGIPDMSRGQSNSQQKPQPSAQSFSNASPASNGQGSKYSYNTSSKSASTQFDSIFGDLDSSKQSRPMKKAVEPSTRPASMPKTVSPPEESSIGAPDQLDDIFGMTQGQHQPVSAAPAHDDLLGAFQDSSLGSPSERFGTPLSSPHPVVSAQQPSDDLLGGFEGSLGVEDHSIAAAAPEIGGHSRAPQQASMGLEDDLDIFATPAAPSVTKALGTGMQRRSSSQDVDRTAPQTDSSAATPPRRPQSAGSQVGVERVAPRAAAQPPRPSPMQKSSAALAQVFDEAAREPPSASSNGHITSAARDPERTSRPAPSHRQHQASTTSKEELKDNAKEWLDKGQKWLMGAGKKLAAAAKEAQSTIQTRIEDMEVFKHSQGKGQMWSPSDDDHVPEYYRQWAATIARLGHDEQMRTLAQMSEDDRLIVQRLMDRSSVRQPGSTDLDRPEAKAGSASERTTKPPTRESSGEWQQNSAAPSQQYTRASSSGNLQARQQGSPAVRAAARRSSSYNLGDAKVESSAASSAGVAPQHSFDTAAEPAHPVAHPAPAKDIETHHPEADLLGFSTGADEVAPAPATKAVHASSQPSSAKSRKAGVLPPEEDLLNLSGEAPSKPQAAAPLAAHAPKASAPAADDDDDLLGGFSQAPAAASAQKQQPRSGPPQSTADADIEAMFGGQPASQHRAGGSMIDFGDEAPLEAAHVFADPGDLDVEGEPEIRRQLRARRLAEKQAQMRAALAEKVARDVQESAEKERKVELREEYKQCMAAWRQGKDGNIRALLATLDTVLWEESGWKKPSMTDLVDPKRVKRAYMMANLVVHPDKVKQKGGTVEQIVVADIAFDTLKSAWSKFESGELRG